MREIKFRAWDGKNMVAPSKNFLIDSYGGYAFWSFGFDLDIQPGWEVMQYTGLDDINGVEIYEGDVVECDLSFEGGKLPHAGVIVYVDTFGAFATKNLSGETLLHNHIPNSYLVIGNIYQNPELLLENKPK